MFKIWVKFLELALLKNNFIAADVRTQVRIAEADNTAQYWPNLGSQQSAIEMHITGPYVTFTTANHSGSDGQSLGQNCPPTAYRSYHSSNGTILAVNLRQHFCRCWTSVGPYLTSHSEYFCNSALDLLKPSFFL